MSKNSNKIIGLGIGLAAVSIILWTAYTRSWNSASSWDLITNEYIALFGWLFFTGIGIIYLKQRNITMLQSVIFGALIGFGFSAVIQYMYTNNIWFDSVITGSNALWEIQLVIVTLWTILGIIKGA